MESALGTWKAKGRRASLARLVCVGTIAGVASLVNGCTVYPEKKPPTLTSTTSAEQRERIFWQLVSDGKGVQAERLLAPDTVWHLPEGTLERSQLGRLLSNPDHRTYVVRDVQIKPNGADRTLTYTLEVSSPKGEARAPEQISAISVWQDLKDGAVMIVHSEQQPRR